MAGLGPQGFRAYDLFRAVGREFELVTAVMRLVCGGVLDEFPRLTIVMSHFAPNKDIMTAQLSQSVREWAKSWGIANFFEAGKGGIEHVLLPDEGLIKPGEVIVGGDSHSVTYGAWNAFGAGIGSTDLACAMATGEIWLRVPETIRVTLTGQLPPGVDAKDIALALCRILGADGATYQALEFTGPALDTLDLDDRLVLGTAGQERDGQRDESQGQQPVQVP